MSKQIINEQIIVQPDGQYAIWSSVVDDFIYTNISSKEEIIEIFVHRARHNITRQVNNTIKLLNDNKKPYFQFTKTFIECLEIIKNCHRENTGSLLSLKAEEE